MDNRMIRSLVEDEYIDEIESRGEFRIGDLVRIVGINDKVGRIVAFRENRALVSYGPKPLSLFGPSGTKQDEYVPLFKLVKAET